MAGNLVQWLLPNPSAGWNSTYVYSSSTEDGTYTQVGTVTITRSYFFDPAGTASTWYKIAFYKTSGTVLGALSDPFQALPGQLVSDTTTYITALDLRKFMQFETNDPPNDEDMTRIISQASVDLLNDIGGTTTISDPKMLRLLSLLVSASYVCRSLATKALSKGYISVSMEGINIMKAHDALMGMSDRYYQKYQEMLAKSTVDYSATSYLDQIDIYMSQDIKDIMNGISDGLDYESNWMPSTLKRGGRNAPYY